MVWSSPNRLGQYSRNPASHSFALLTMHCKMAFHLVAHTQEVCVELNWKEKVDEWVFIELEGRREGYSK